MFQSLTPRGFRLLGTLIFLCLATGCLENQIMAYRQAEICDNGVDDDGDNAVDCDDSDCECAPVCGNGSVDTGEDCDGDNLAGASCLSLGFTGGSLSCASSCLYDTSQCTGSSQVCGNEIVDAGEECDGSDLGGASCLSLGFTGGSLSCDVTCQHDTSDCTDGTEVCGNGAVEAGEDCDGGDLSGATCVSLGFSGGTLGCSASCIFDTAQCT